MLLKAAAGGGGKGMRVVRDAGEIDAALDAARREAKNAFGDDAVYVEKYIVGPRHVEIQVLGDQHGTMLSLNERECSVQRRHQKMIEEAPSVAVTPELRRAMGETAVRAARAAGYVNAGTCEFLLDRDGKFYFLEMNTRLQVEHPGHRARDGHRPRAVADSHRRRRAAARSRRTTSCRAAGRSSAASRARIRRTAFSRRPGASSICTCRAVPGVRWDGGIEVGSEVGLFYDPMLAKLIVHAPTREAAVARMHRALLELTIEGVETSRDFHLRVMEDAEFRAGAIEIQWLERRLDSLVARRRPPATASGGRLVARADRRSRSTRARQTPSPARPRVDAARRDAWRARPRDRRRCDDAWPR